MIAEVAEEGRRNLACLREFEKLTPTPARLRAPTLPVRGRVEEASGVKKKVEGEGGLALQSFTTSVSGRPPHSDHEPS